MILVPKPVGTPGDLEALLATGVFIHARIHAPNYSISVLLY